LLHGISITNSDSIIFFKDMNIVHMGDVFWNGLYPLIDAGTGGSIHGMINAVEETLAATDADTKFMPGHGPLASRTDLVNFRDMLKAVVMALTPYAEKDVPLEEVVKAGPLKALNPVWGNGILKPTHFISVVYPPMAQHEKGHKH